MSDLAQGLSCPRTVVANKLAVDDPTLNLNKLLQLERGHWLEAGLEKSFNVAGQPLISQLEIAITHEGVPIKAHLDSTLFDKVTQGVTVLEIKSMAKIHDEIFETHEAQLNGQIGLLSKFWNDPVFRLEVNIDYIPFPQIASNAWGVDLPKDPVVNGFVLAVSPNEARAFGPYYQDSFFLDTLLDRGVEIWKYVEDINNNVSSLTVVPFNNYYSPLCSYCHFNKDCPKYSGDSCPSLESKLESLTKLKSSRSTLDDEIKEKESQLKSVSALMGKSNQWISANSYRFKVGSQKGRITIDQNLLKDNLSQVIGLDDESLINLLASSQKEGQPFDKFYLSPIN
jgi:hypothetical protein